MVTVNNKEMEWKEGLKVSDAILFGEYVEYNFPILVVSQNGLRVKSEVFKTTPVNDGDVIKIMQPLDEG